MALIGLEFRLVNMQVNSKQTDCSLSDQSSRHVDR